jgi:tRNA (cytidine/uridine-2'-O-)-methyltransferase
MSLNVVLLNPEIPTNTGNIGRLCLATDTSLHLIKPLGFEINDKRLKRAGLDYWQHLEVKYYNDFNEFIDLTPKGRLHFFSSNSNKSIWDLKFDQNDYLVFGKESVGLPESITSFYKDNCYKIPMYNPKIRSLNLANAVSIAVFEGLRQLTLNN